MLGMGMASSHAPMMFQKAQFWPRMVERRMTPGER
jgi:hypothetical protein